MAKTTVRICTSHGSFPLLSSRWSTAITINKLPSHRRCHQSQQRHHYIATATVTVPVRACPRRHWAVVLPSALKKLNHYGYNHSHWHTLTWHIFTPRIVIDNYSKTIFLLLLLYYYYYHTGWCLAIAAPVYNPYNIHALSRHCVASYSWRTWMSRCVTTREHQQ